MAVLKVLMINGSPRKNGNTAIALKEMERYSGLKASKRKLSKLATRISVAVLPVIHARKMENASLMTLSIKSLQNFRMQMVW